MITILGFLLKEFISDRLAWWISIVNDPIFSAVVWTSGMSADQHTVMNIIVCLVILGCHGLGFIQGSNVDSLNSFNKRSSIPSKPLRKLPTKNNNYNYF